MSGRKTVSYDGSGGEFVLYGAGWQKTSPPPGVDGNAFLTNGLGDRFVFVFPEPATTVTYYGWYTGDSKICLDCDDLAQGIAPLSASPNNGNKSPIVLFQHSFNEPSLHSLVVVNEVDYSRFNHSQLSLNRIDLEVVGDSSSTSADPDAPTPAAGTSTTLDGISTAFNGNPAAVDGIPTDANGTPTAGRDTPASITGMSTSISPKESTASTHKSTPSASESPKCDSRSGGCSKKTPVAAIAGGVVGGVMVLVLFIVVFISWRRYGRKRSLGGSGTRCASGPFITPYDLGVTQRRDTFAIEPPLNSSFEELLQDGGSCYSPDSEARTGTSQTLAVVSPRTSSNGTLTTHLYVPTDREGWMPSLSEMRAKFRRYSRSHRETRPPEGGFIVPVTEKDAGLVLGSLEGNTLPPPYGHFLKN